MGKSRVKIDSKIFTNIPIINTRGTFVRYFCLKFKVPKMGSRIIRSCFCMVIFQSSPFVKNELINKYIKKSKVEYKIGSDFILMNFPLKSPLIVHIIINNNMITSVM